jgi:predicted cupin superfamily sugar epimerase
VEHLLTNWNCCFISRKGAIVHLVCNVNPAIIAGSLGWFCKVFVGFFAILAGMKYLLAVSLVIAGVITVLADPQEGSDARAREIIQTLHLTVLPKESGYLGIIGRSAQMVKVDGRALAVQSQNYYMLTHDHPINYLHWLAPDDTHILIEGGPVDYFIFHPDGHAEKVTLGLDLAAGQRPVVAVPGGCWKALRLLDGASYALMANTLSPEFTPDRVKIGAGPDWVKRFSNSAPWATPKALRELIGPNWMPD